MVLTICIKMAAAKQSHWLGQQLSYTEEQEVSLQYTSLTTLPSPCYWIDMVNCCTLLSYECTTYWGVMNRSTMFAIDIMLKPSEESCEALYSSCPRGMYIYYAVG